MAFTREVTEETQHALVADQWGACTVYEVRRDDVLLDVTTEEPKETDWQADFYTVVRPGLRCGARVVALAYEVIPADQRRRLEVRASARAKLTAEEWKEVTGE